MSDNFELVESVFAEYEKLANTDILKVPEPARTLIVIYSTHGVICNGGFRFFFENDFKGYSDYNIVIESYSKANLDDHAEAISNLLKLFPNSKPHENLKFRRAFLAKYFEIESEEYLNQVDDAENLFYEDSDLPYSEAVKYYQNYTE